MVVTNEQEHDRFDTLLRSAARPATPRSGRLEAEIAALATSIAAPRLRRRRMSIVAAVLAPVLVLGGATAAFAAVGVNWSPFFASQPAWTAWATHPDASITYRLPSGTRCTMRIGGFAFSPQSGEAEDSTTGRAAVALARHYLQGGTVLRDAPIKATIAKDRRTEVNWTTDSNGKQVRFGYGTPNYNPDVEYSIALKEAIQATIDRHLQQAGLPSDGLTYASQERCDGTAW